MSFLSARRIPGSALDKGMKAREHILNMFDRLIDQFVKENPEDSERAKTTVMGRLIYGKDKENDRMLTKDEVKDNMITLIFAGHDTTTASMSTILYHLSQNQDAMEALSTEVSSLSDPLTPEELKNAPVLNACIHESLRVDPPISGAYRQSAKGVQYNGYSFEQGTVFKYSILMTTSDERVYKEPARFNMRRFLPKEHPLYRSEDDSNVDPLQGRSSYPIFGGGTHQCLGRSFAQLELRILVARIARHYKLEVRNPKKTGFPISRWSIEFKLTPKDI